MPTGLVAPLTLAASVVLVMIISRNCQGAGSGGFEEDGDALADADAHGGQGTADAAVVQFDGGGQGDPGPAGAQRVTQRDRAAVRVDVLGVLRETELPQHAECLRGERL